MKRVMAGVFCMMWVGCAAFAQTTPPVSQHAVLVELFTSEGCSDCPAADDILAKMDGKRTPDGTAIIGLSEHVTYFNSSAYTDPYSDESYTQRQKEYADRFKAESYTPMAVVMGSTQMKGGDGYGILKAADAAKNADVTVHIQSAKRDGKKLTVGYSVEGTLPKRGADIIAFLADDADMTQIPGGENKGRTLHHVSVVRAMKKLGSVKDAAAHTADMGVSAAKGPQHLVVVAQEADTGKVLAAETIALN